MAKTEKHKKISIKYYLNKDLKSQKKMTVNGEVDTHPVYVRIIYDKNVNRFRFPDEKVGFLSDEDFGIFENSQVAHNQTELIEKYLRMEALFEMKLPLKDFNFRLMGYQMRFYDMLILLGIRGLKENYFKKIVPYSDYKDKVEQVQDLHQLRSLIAIFPTSILAVNLAYKVIHVIYELIVFVKNNCANISSVEFLEQEDYRNKAMEIIASEFDGYEGFEIFRNFIFDKN